MKLSIGLILVIILSICIAKHSTNKKNKEKKQPYYNSGYNNYNGNNMYAQQNNYNSYGLRRQPLTGGGPYVHATTNHGDNYMQTHQSGYFSPNYRTNPLNYRDANGYNNYFGPKVHIDNSPNCNIGRQPFSQSCSRYNTCNTCTNSQNCGWCGKTNRCVPGVSRQSSCGNYCKNNWNFDSNTCNYNGNGWSTRNMLSNRGGYGSYYGPHNYNGYANQYNRRHGQQNYNGYANLNSHRSYPGQLYYDPSMRNNNNNYQNSRPNYGYGNY